MRTLKYFSIFIGIVGTYCLFCGLYGVAVHFSPLYRETASRIYPGYMYITLSVVGLSGIISAGKLNKYRTWARSLWLGSSLVLASAYLLPFIRECLYFPFDKNAVAQPAAASLIAAFSWVILNMPSVKKAFSLDNEDKIPNLSASFVIGGIGIVFLVSLAAVFGNLSKPVISAEMLVGKGKAVFPSLITPTQDKGFLFAGSIFISDCGNSEKTMGVSQNEKYPCAWKTDPAGKIEWIYTEGCASLPDVFSSNTSLDVERRKGKAEYVSSAVLPDGSVFLFDSSMGVTILDQNGNLLNRSTLDPGRYDVKSILACRPAGDGFLLVGLTYTRSGATSYEVPMIRFPAPRDYFYKFIMLDKQFNMISEKKSRQSPELAPDYSFGDEPYSSALYQLPDKQSLFVMSGSEVTDVIRLGPDGDILAQCGIPSRHTEKDGVPQQYRYILAATFTPDSSFTLVSSKTDPLIVISFDEKLRAVTQSIMGTTSGAITSACRNTDGSLILFGSQFIENAPIKYIPLIIRTDPALRHMIEMKPWETELTVLGGNRFKEWAYVAATPLGPSGTCAGVRGRCGQSLGQEDVRNGMTILDIVR